MTASEHTPGPWWWDDAYSELRCFGGVVLWPNNACETSPLGACGEGVEHNQEANARLIAAAPALLALAEGMQRYIGSIPPKLVTPGLKRQLLGCKAAIAAARGTDA